MKTKRIPALLLALVMSVTMLSGVSVWAAVTGDQTGGAIGKVIELFINRYVKHTDHNDWTELKLGEDGIPLTADDDDNEGYFLASDHFYYLSEDLETDAPLVIKDSTVALCLNGHSITMGSEDAAIVALDNGNLILLDCGETPGCITHKITDGETAKGSGLLLLEGGTCIMFGGEICGNE